ncbi:hypothetical protein BD289DRAFT_379877 [Coniella lustricola]|uniref:Uncharacterized protein n=1 Tax=Coniella lustricola TaxID=2025994 RepID=A0A2T2ZS36_9PEZI|nr:hypothetical protein BD289DRAFT_379877 [Coniella lustricola]
MSSYLITGSSRGLGLAMATKLLENPNNTVIATARDTAGSPGLQQLAKKHSNDRLILIDLDVTDEQSVLNAAAQASEHLPHGLDHLLSNAGISPNPTTSLDDLDIGETLDEINFNIKAALLVLRAFVPLVRRSTAKKIFVMTSVLGSLAASSSMPNLANAYSVAKAALNMLTRKWAAVLKEDGITTILMHPGYVGETDMGSSAREWIAKYAPDIRSIPLEQSAAGCLAVLDRVTLEDNGDFFQWDGDKVPW